jgi:hypothetical protein
MKTVKGWRKIDQQRGFLNETTGQNLLVWKKEFAPYYVVKLFPKAGLDVNGEVISPAYATASKAEAYGLSWMVKHPKGTEALAARTSGGGEGEENE